MKKKTISMLLAVVMLISAFPLVSFAASRNVTNTYTLTADETILSGEVWSISATGRVVIPAGMTLTVKNGALITNAGIIENHGTILIEPRGTLNTVNNGVVKHEVRLPGGETGKYTVYRFAPELPETTDPASTEYDESYMIRDYNYEAIADNTTTAVWATQGKPFYFRIVLQSNEYDINKLPVRGNGMNAPYRVGTFIGFNEITNSVDVTYGRGTGNAYDEYLRKTFRIPLKSDTGYQVVAYYKGMSWTNEVEVAYGDSFVFTVQLDPLYDRSDYTITIGGNVPAMTEDGKYYISPVVTDLNNAYMNGAYDINIAGIMSNEMKDTFSGIMAFIKQIAQTFADIFQTFMEMFNLGGLTTA